MNISNEISDLARSVLDVRLESMQIALRGSVTFGPFAHRKVLLGFHFNVDIKGDFK